MALSEKDKGIKDQQAEQLAQKISDKTTQRDRLIDQQAANLQKVNDELDTLILQKKGLDAIDQVDDLSTQVDELTAQIAVNAEKTVGEIK